MDIIDLYVYGCTSHTINGLLTYIYCSYLQVLVYIQHFNP